MLIDKINMEHTRVIHTPDGDPVCINLPIFENFPIALTEHPNWLLVKAKFLWSKKKQCWELKKPMHTIGIDHPIDYTDPQYHLSFEAAKAEYLTHPQTYIGVAIILKDDLRIVGVDKDECWLEELRSPESKELAERYKNTYQELSLRNGGHIVLSAEAIKNHHKDGIEIYWHNRPFVITGHTTNHLDVTNYQEELDKHFEELGVVRSQGITKEKQQAPYAPPQSVPALQPEDIECIIRTLDSKNGYKFMKLWKGETDWYLKQYAQDKSYNAAETAFQDILAFACGNNDQMHRIYYNSGLARDKWDSRRGTSTYGDNLVQNALQHVHVRRTNKKEYRCSPRERFIQPYQEEKHQQSIRDIRMRIFEKTQKFLQNGTGILLINVTPGAGKTRTLASIPQKIGMHVNWFAPTHAQAQQIPELQAAEYRELFGCNEENCPTGHERHNELGKAGIPTHVVHENHDCFYKEQQDHKGSLIYQYAHLPSGIAREQAYIMDDPTFQDFISETSIYSNDLKFVLRYYKEDNTIQKIFRLLFKGLWQVDTEDIENEFIQSVSGKELAQLFASLTEHELSYLLLRLSTHPDLKYKQYYLKDPESYAERKHAKAATILSQVYWALKQEMKYWSIEQDWNSRICLVPGKKRPYYLITTPLSQEIFQDQPAVIADGTTNVAIIKQLFPDLPLSSIEEKIEFPENTRHIHHEGYYGKWAIEHANRGYMDTIYGRCKKALKEHSAGGSKIGLITYKGFYKQLAKELDIPLENCRYFWNNKGTNTLEDCDVLLVVGTPTLPSDVIYQYAQAIYHGQTAIIKGQEKGKDGRHHYIDQRCEDLNNFITASEVSQSAYRIRPANYNNKTIITLTAAQIDPLCPITHDLEFGALDRNGEEKKLKRAEEREQKMEIAYQKMFTGQQKITERSFVQEAKVSTRFACLFLEKKRLISELYGLYSGGQTTTTPTRRLEIRGSVLDTEKGGKEEENSLQMDKFEADIP